MRVPTVHRTVAAWFVRGRCARLRGAELCLEQGCSRLCRDLLPVVKECDGMVRRGAAGKGGVLTYAQALLGLFWMHLAPGQPGEQANAWAVRHTSIGCRNP